MSNSLTSFFDETQSEPILREFLRWALKGRKDRVRQLFTNEVHFEVFKHLPKYPSHVMVSKSYVVFQYTWRRKEGYFEKKVKESWTYYVIGINSDGKLFINKLTTPPSFSPFGLQYDIGKKRPIEINATKDSEVANLMGFDYDSERSPIKSIPVAGNESEDSGLKLNSYFMRYRVQGDLRLLVDYVMDSQKEFEELYMADVKRALIDQVENAIAEILLERINLTLAAHNITTVMFRERGNRLLILEAVPRRKARSYDEEVANKIFNLLDRELYYQDMGGELMLNKYDRPYWERPVETILVSISETRGRFGSPYRSLAIEAKPSRYSIDKALGLIMRDIKPNIEPRVVYFGRHKVAFSGLPSRFTIATELPFNNLDGLEDKRIFNISLHRFYVAEGDLEVSHVEHGTHKYSVVKPIVGRFESIRLDDNFDNRLSHYALKAL